MPRVNPLELSEQDFLVWLDQTTDERGLKRAIGGSAIGALMGLNPYKTAADVWDDLLAPRVTRGENRHADRGTRMEPIIRDIYVRDTGRAVQVVQPNTCLIDGVPFRSMPDGMMQDERGSGIWEAKCPDVYGYEAILQNGISPSYYAQVQQYGMLESATWAAFAVFNVNAWELHHFDLAMDPAFHSDIIRVGQRFWREHILTRQRPSESHSEAIVAAMPIRLGAEAVLLEDRETRNAIATLMEAKQELNIAQAKFDGAKAKIQEKMVEANAEIIQCQNTRISWKEVTRRTLDKDMLEAAGIDPTPYYKVSVSRTFLPKFG